MRFAGILLAALLLAALPACDSPAEPTLESGGIFILVSSGANPLEGARVDLTSEDGETFSRVTAENGFAIVFPASRGMWQVLLHVPAGHQLGSSTVANPQTIVVGTGDRQYRVYNFQLVPSTT